MFLTDIKVARVLMCLATLYYQKKCIKVQKCVKFCVKNKIVCSSSLKMLTVAVGECTLRKKKKFIRHDTSASRKRWQNVNDGARPRRSSISTIDEKGEVMKKIVAGNRRIAIREVAYRLAHVAQFVRMF